MVEHLEIGLKLQAEYSLDGQFYLATVVAISRSRKQQKAPVKVRFEGYDDEEWKAIEQLRSKKLPKSKVQCVSKAKASSSSTFTQQATATASTATADSTAVDIERPLRAPPAPAALLEKMCRQIPLSAADEELLQGPWCRPNIALENYIHKREAGLRADKKSTVRDLRKGMPNVFNDGSVARVLAASLPPDCVLRQLESQLQGTVFHISSCERGAYRGGSRRMNVPMPIFEKVCDVLHLRGVVTPCLNDLKTFVLGRWTLVWVDLSAETAQWLTATFNVLTRAGFWQITITRDHEVISAFPIAAGLLGERKCSVAGDMHPEGDPTRCGVCRGCTTAGDQWSLLPSVYANCVRVRRPSDATHRMGCTCGRLYSKDLKEQFKCTCEPCLGEMRLWADAVKNFELACRNQSVVQDSKAQLLHYATHVACGSCVQDRRRIAEAIIAGGSEQTICSALLPWLAKQELEEVTLRVCEVRFSQHSISSTFTGDHKGNDIESLVRAFRLGLLTPMEKPIRVVRYHGEFWALDHRRLWAIQQYQLLEPDEDVHVRAEVLPLCNIEKTTSTAAAIKEFNKKYSTVSEGIHMHIKHTPANGSGTPSMNRTALASIVFGDLKQVRGQRGELKDHEFTMGLDTFSSIRELKEKLELLRGDNVDGSPLPKDAFSLLMDILRFHELAASHSEDVVCITVSSSEKYRTPAFWLWRSSGYGRDVGTKDCLEHLNYYLSNSPTRNRHLVDILSQKRHAGCVDQLGPRFGYIKLADNVSTADDTIEAGTPLFVVTHDLPMGLNSAISSQVTFLVFRWGLSSKNAGKLGAVDIRAK